MKRMRSAGDESLQHYLNNAMLAAAVMVVVGHAIVFLTNVSKGNQLEKSFFVAIYSVSLPLLPFLCGLSADKGVDAPFPRRRVLFYLISSIVLRIVISLERIALGESERFSVLNMYDSYTWLFGALAVFHALAWMLRRVDGRVTVPIALAVGCMAGYDVFLGDALSLMRIAVFFPVFFIGYCLDARALVWLLKRWWVKVLAVGVLLAFGALCLLNKDFVATFRILFTGRNGFERLGELYPFAMLLRLSCYAISCVTGLALLSLVPRARLGFLSTAGERGLQIYFYHKLILILFEHFKLYDLLEKKLGETPATGLYVALAVGVALLCSVKPLALPKRLLLNAFRKS